MSYVPTHLTHVETDSTGWPAGLEESEKDALVEYVTRSLKALGGTATLHQIHSHVRRSAYFDKELCPKYGRSVLWDYTYACIDRALRAAQAEQTWTLPK
jgi:hypothetical protein